MICSIRVWLHININKSKVFTAAATQASMPTALKSCSLYRKLVSFAFDVGGIIRRRNVEYGALLLIEKKGVI